MQPTFQDFDNKEKGGQIVLTEVATECFFNAIADSNIGTVFLDT